MIFSALIKDIGCKTAVTACDDDITEIVLDSRTAPPASALFVCIKGYSFDSHSCAAEMYGKGVRHFVAEHDLQLPQDAVVALCDSSRRALALISSAFFGHPSKELCTVALTGTKGKSSTSFMIKNILEDAGHRVGIIGTTGIFYGDTYIESENSTPESYLIHKYMRDMITAGCDTLVMEASSQGFKLDRTYGINFDIGVFTNLSPDHIGPNEHKDFEEYKNCKKMLFSQCKIGVFNADDRYCDEISDGCLCKKVTFGCNGNHDYTAANPYFGLKDGRIVTEYDINCKGEKKRLSLPLPGEISVFNSLCAAAVTSTLGCSLENIQAGLSRTVIRGRNEAVSVPADFSVILDYAHNEISIESIFKTLMHYRTARIITVFGCGGNRSRLRRFAMGDIITRNSDVTIITSDNPRYENPDDIITDIKSGIKAPYGPVETIKDRREAIYRALSLARKDDIVLIVGKGNQDYEEIEGVKYPFDEREVVADYFKYASK